MREWPHTPVDQRRTQAWNRLEYLARQLDQALRAASDDALVLGTGATRRVEDLQIGIRGLRELLTVIDSRRRSETGAGYAEAAPRSRTA